MKRSFWLIRFLACSIFLLQFAAARAVDTSLSWTNALRFSPDGKSLISAGLITTGKGKITDTMTPYSEIIDKRLRVWDVKSGREIYRLPSEPITSDFSDFAVGRVLLLPDFQTMLTSCWGWKIKSVDVHSFHFHKPIEVQNGLITSLALSPDEEILAIGVTRAVEFRDARTYRLLRSYQHGGQGTSVHFGPDSQTVVCFWKRSKPQAVDVATARQVPYPRWVYRIQDADAFAFAADGKTLAKAKAKTIEIWTTPVNGGGLKIATFSTILSTVRTLAFSPDGKVLAVGGSSSTTRPVELIRLPSSIH